MVGRRWQYQWVLAALAVLAVLGGGWFLGDYASAQGPAGGSGGPGRFGGPGGAGPMGRGGRGGPGGPDALGALMLHRLDLNETQRDQVKQILDAQRESQRALQQRAMAAREALDATLISSPLDEAAIRGRAAELASVEADVVVARGQVYSQVLQVLTAEQQTQLAQFQAERKNRTERMREQRNR